MSMYVKTPHFPEHMGPRRRWLWWKLLPYAGQAAYGKPTFLDRFAYLVWRNL